MRTILKHEKGEDIVLETDRFILGDRVWGKGRRYYLNPIVKDGKLVTEEVDRVRGLTSVAKISQLDPSVLARWAVEQNSYGFSEILSEILLEQDFVKSNKDVVRLAEKGSSYYEKIVKESTDIGNYFNDLTEKVCEYQNKKIKKEDLLKFIEDTTKKNPNKKFAVSKFMEMIGKHKIKILATELLCYSKEYNVATRIDALIEMDGKIKVWELKTSKIVGFAETMQTAMGRVLYNETWDAGSQEFPLAESAVLVHFYGKDKIGADGLVQRTAGEFEIYEPDIEEFEKAFQHQNKLFKFFKKNEKINKALNIKKIS